MFLKYLFIETIRNTYEHADIGEVYLSAQKWPSKSLLEIAISDTGCGISNSLRKYRPYSDKDEKELIKLSCEPGVSSRSNYRYLEKDNVWRNSGYGLYLMRKLAVAYGGSFLICSGNYALRENKEGIRIFNTAYEGTTIAIRVKQIKYATLKKFAARLYLWGKKHPQMQNIILLLQDLLAGL